ncbi:hypothetical protein [Hymenobacter cellulosivorans]|uniref:Uncharacterized protein n=1 Tax=Hymenobacter cellulosivorans TaxID=2932249 RepID=A0ABY4FBA5_9BACT|nr:hypothetical protein [Hymenobacter cellulosivorans]UOQ51731.1 hypothetical protein MUN80_18440 [Hymenobacter cellulosivorans]
MSYKTTFTVLHSLLATASDLAHWASLLEGKSTFPELMRRLIRATTPTLTRLSFPSAEGVQLEGWDGLTSAGTATPFVPSGSTGWELGTNVDQKGKADDDYDTRTANPLELNPADATFIFCTPRRWGKRKKWADARSKEGKWRDVRAYDADDLITWLTDAPATHIWLSRLLSKQPNGVQDLESWWQDWANQTTPIMQPEWLLAGRTAAQNRLTTWLNEPSPAPKPYSVFASTADEARAFFAASILALPDEQRVNWLARTIVVSDEYIWQQLINTQEKLLLVVEFESDRLGQLCAAATRQGHRVILPRPSTQAAATDDVVPPLGREELRQTLEDVGISKLDAAEKASLARRSFTAFHRTLLVDKSLQRLWWQEPAVAVKLLPLALLGRWTDTEEGDQAIVSGLTGKPYPEVQAQLTEWAALSNSPVRRITDEWFIIDPADVWEQCARFLTPTIYQRFGEAVQEVLARPLVRFSLPPDERMFAGVRPIHDKYSSTLRKGLVSTLALISSSLGAESGNQSALIAWVNQQLSQLFEQAFADPSGHLLASLNYHIPALAEAAPDLFLTSLLRELQQPESVLLTLFQEERGLMHNVSHHTGLLWALEGLAWVPQYLSDASAVLAGLARLDPGGQLSNRPANSLRLIFLGWKPQTNATVAERLAVIDRLRHEEPGVAWILLLRLLPQYHDTSWENHTPTFHWRDWQINPDQKVSAKDYFAFIEGVTQRLLTDAGTDAERWSQVISDLPQLLSRISPSLGQRVLQQLSSLGTLGIPAEQQADLLREVRKFLNHHRSHPDADWAWLEERLVPLQQLYDQLQPVDLLQRNAWYFDQWPLLAEGIVYKSGNDSHEIIRTVQANALSELVATHGLDVIPELLTLAPSAYHVGDAVGLSTQLTEADKTDLLQKYLASPDDRENKFALGIASSYAWRMGAEAAEMFIRPHFNSWSPAQIATWLRIMPATPATWQLAKEAGAAVEESYWLMVPGYVQNDDDSVAAARQLLSYRRPLTAAHVLSLYQRSAVPMPNELVLETLEFIAREGHGADEGQQLRGYELDTLLEELENTPAEHRNRAISMAFIFSRQNSYKTPTILDRALREEPSFFVEVLGYLYKPDIDTEEQSDATSDTETESNETEDTGQASTRMMLATLAWHLLHDWESVPGKQPDGTFNGDALKAWVDEVRALTSSKQLTKAFSIQVGKTLSHAPSGPDGNWPHPAVCDILQQERNNQKLFEEFRTGCYNRHGKTHPVTGGQREQAIANDYTIWADHYRTSHPAAAGLLRQLADTFNQMADQERQQAAREDQFGM